MLKIKYINYEISDNNISYFPYEIVHVHFSFSNTHFIASNEYMQSTWYSYFDIIKFNNEECLILNARIKLYYDNFPFYRYAIQERNRQRKIKLIIVLSIIILGALLCLNLNGINTIH